MDTCSSIYVYCLQRFLGRAHSFVHKFLLHAKLANVGCTETLIDPFVIRTKAKETKENVKFQDYSS